MSRAARWMPVRCGTTLIARRSKACWHGADGLSKLLCVRAPRQGKTSEINLAHAELVGWQGCHYFLEVAAVHGALSLIPRRIIRGSATDAGSCAHSLWTSHPASSSSLRPLPSARAVKHKYETCTPDVCSRVQSTFPLVPRRCFAPSLMLTSVSTVPVSLIGLGVERCGGSAQCMYMKHECA